MHKILKELDSHFIVELPNGATIKIAKGGLSSHMKEKVMFMAEGGMVPDKGFIPDTSGPVPGEVVPINVLPKTPPEARFTGVTRATPEEQMQAAKFAPGTADIYKTAVDQPRPVKQAPIQPYMPEQAPGGAEEAPISPLDFPMEAASLAGAGAKGLVRGAMAGREAIYKAIPRLASEVGAIGGEKVAPRINPLGMYSKLEQTIAEKMGGSATPEQIKGMLRDVKPEEMQYSKLNDFLQGKDKISKQEVLDFVKANELPVQEKILGGSRNVFIEENPKNSPFPFAITDDKGNVLEGFSNRSYAENALKDYNKTPTKFSEYTLLGGENYREKLYTLPPKKVPGSDIQLQAYQRRLDELLAKDLKKGLSDSEYQTINDLEYKIEDLKNSMKNPEGSYKSSHWDEPNVLAHTRLNDRIDDEGKKHLFVEEIQSDWHQAGRKKGYKGQYKFEPLTDKNISNIEDNGDFWTFYVKNKDGKEVAQNIYKKEWDPVSKTKVNAGYTQETAKEAALKKINEIEERHVKFSNEQASVPDAPMKKTWHEFVSKNLLSDAAKGGYDNISWTTGAQQAERYDLSKKIKDIELTDLTKASGKGFELKAYDVNGDAVLVERLNNVEDAEKYIGKDLTKKLKDKKFKENDYGVDQKNLTKIDFEIGGEGMKGFYDKMIPDYMAKIGKKYGVKPEKTNINAGKFDFKYIGKVPSRDEIKQKIKTAPNVTVEKQLRQLLDVQNISEESIAKVISPSAAEHLGGEIKEIKIPEQVWTMKITPEMRKDILEKGLPLYAMGGVVAGGTLNSKEAGAKDMNYKMLENNKDHYIMKHPDGSSFKVAKKGLNPEIMKKIEGYADFVQRAEGQIPGVDIPEQNASYMPEQPKEPDFAQMAQQAPRTKEDDYARRINQATGDIYRGLESTYGARMGMIPEEYTPEKVRSMAEEQVLGQAEREAVKAKNQAYLAKQDEERSRQDVMAYNERAAKVGMPLRPIPGEKQELPLEAQAKQVEQPQAPEPQMAAQKYVDPFALYEKGIRGESAAKAEYAQQEAETYKKLQEDMNNGNKMFNDKLAKLYEQGDALKKAAESKNIDPNRYWSNLGTANKIGASISMILGSLGGALSGTDNVALKIIDKTIDNDIEAQKKNIDQANNLYRTNLEAVKSEQEAYNITKAQMIGNAEQVLKQKLATATSKEAIAQGQMALAKMQLAKQELLQKSAVDTVVQAAQSNPKLLTPEIIQKLPEKERELVVPGYGFAISKAGAEKIRTELLPQKDTSVQMIDDLINIRKQYGREISDREVVAKARALKTFIGGNMRTFIVGPGSVTPEERKIIDDVIVDPTKIITTDAGTIASLTGLKQGIERSFNNQAKANGLLVPQEQAQSQQPVRGADGKFYIKQGRYMVPVTK